MYKKKSQIRLDENMSGHIQKKWKCPSCGQKRFVRFYDFGKLEYLAEEFGRCDRSDNCGYYSSPYSTEGFKPGKPQGGVEFVPEPVKIAYVDKNILARTLDRYDENNFVQFMISRVGVDRAMETCGRFFIGTAKGNGTIFWQVDNFMMVRTGQLIFYKTDGHRDKATAAKKLFKIENDYRSCLFGLHQLFTETGDFLIAIVESEKTATLASVYLPDIAGRKIVWLASSGSNGLTSEKIASLRGHDVCLVPDFSFHARATWGLVPMRKKYVDREIKGELKKILLPHPDGELTEYESAADRLRSIGCNVSFFDPYPTRDDGSDIADTFVEETAPEEIKLPEFGELLVRFDEQSEISPSEQLSDPVRSIPLAGRHSFKLIKETGGKKEIITNNLDVKERLEKFLSDERVKMFVDAFGLESGRICFGE